MPLAFSSFLSFLLFLYSSPSWCLSVFWLTSIFFIFFSVFVCLSPSHKLWLLEFSFLLSPFLLLISHLVLFLFLCLCHFSVVCCLSSSCPSIIVALSMSVGRNCPPLDCYSAIPVVVGHCPVNHRHHSTAIRLLSGCHLILVQPPLGHCRHFAADVSHSSANCSCPAVGCCYLASTWTLLSGLHSATVGHYLANYHHSAAIRLLSGVCPANHHHCLAIL